MLNKSYIWHRLSTNVADMFYIRTIRYSQPIKICLDKERNKTEREQKRNEEKEG